MKTITQYINEAKTNSYNSRQKFLTALSNWAKENGFHEIKYNEWYQHGQPEENSVECTDNAVKFHFGEGRYISISNYTNGLRGTIKNTLFTKAGAISQNGYPMGDSFEIDLLDGEKWQLKSSVKNGSMRGSSFDPSKLAGNQADYAFQLITEIVNEKKYIDRIFSKFFKKNADGNYARAYKGQIMKLSDITQNKDKVFKFNMSVGEFFEKALGTNEYDKLEDMFDIKWAFSMHENEQAKKFYEEHINDKVDIEAMYTKIGYNHIEITMDIDKNNFYYAFCDFPDKENSKLNNKCYTAINKFIESNK